jgi:MFS family permease
MYRRLLRRRAFRRLWGGMTVSLLGDALTFTALVWLVYERTGSAAQIGGLVAVATAPVVVGGPLAGVALDRFDRRSLLVADNVLRGAAVGAVPLLAWAGALHTWQLYAVAGLHGLLKMIPLAGVPSLIPELVDDDELEAANGLESVSFALASVAGPAAAGVLVSTAGAANVLVLDAASYGVFALALLGVPARSCAPAERSTARLRDALRFVMSVPVLLATTSMFMLVNVGEAAVAVVLPVYAHEVLGGGPAAYGILVSASGGALLVGSLAAGAATRRLPLGSAIGVCEAAGGALLLPLALRPQLPGALAALAGASLCLGTLTVWAQTIRMRVLPAELRGRVFALLRTSMQATPPLGALLAAPLLGAGGIPLAVVVAAIVIAAPGLAGLLSGALRGGEADGLERAVQRHVQPPVAVEEEQ